MRFGLRLGLILLVMIYTAYIAPYVVPHTPCTETRAQTDTHIRAANPSLDFSVAKSDFKRSN